MVPCMDLAPIPSCTIKDANLRGRDRHIAGFVVFVSPSFEVHRRSDQRPRPRPIARPRRCQQDSRLRPGRRPCCGSGGHAGQAQARPPLQGEVSNWGCHALWLTSLFGDLFKRRFGVLLVQLRKEFVTIEVQLQEVPISLWVVLCCSATLVRSKSKAVTIRRGLSECNAPSRFRQVRLQRVPRIRTSCFFR